MVQYMRNKPIKWGVKLWVLADTTGYTADFIVYTGKDESTEQGLTVLPSRWSQTSLNRFIFKDMKYTLIT